MIEFNFKTEFQLNNISKLKDWLSRVISSEKYEQGDIDFIFCSDEELLKINQEYLNHDTYTDIITFDYTSNKVISGDVFISIDRVRENSNTFKTGFLNELLRVMSHGVLHLMGYKDKDEDDVKVMRAKEEEKIKMFHVEP
ncbi:rRNA maturation RNase YbeY [Muricauda sp. 2012CJ35-5]|uniref:Endoribonuclease YbeY n=1 Tax=Flagellimonas spongiicola TaxID=2942208 RepID=A0ABT0PTE9_9FLAO|nr:rRNA maturation RNase YbeY [Allomuricauda spongiicola]MCL6274256.1 rRNA maturation RNase YbeY [Allomuricauda spongiicola]